MRTVILAATAAFSLGIGSTYAYADGGDGPQTNFYTLPNVAQTSMRNAPSAATVQDGQAIHYATSQQHASPFLLNESGGGR